MTIHSKDFRVPHHKKIDIKHLPTIVKPFCESKKEYKKLLEEHVVELAALQRLQYASNRYALLLIFQGMDSAGKDGAIRHECRESIPRLRGFQFQTTERRRTGT